MSIEVDYPLLPEDDGIPEDAELANAVASVLEEFAPIPGEPPEAYGMTWDLDFAARRFRRQGLAPARLNGIASLAVWCEMAIRTARFAHSAFSDEFGMERPEDILGHVDVGELIGDYHDRMRDALLIHDRIVEVENFDSDYDPGTGTLTIFSFDVITDDEQRLPFGPLRVEIGA